MGKVVKLFADLEGLEELSHSCLGQAARKLAKRWRPLQSLSILWLWAYGYSKLEEQTADFK